MPDYVDHMYIVNDGSQDQTLTILNAFADHDPRIIVVDHEENKGLGQSLIEWIQRLVVGEFQEVRRQYRSPRQGLSILRWRWLRELVARLG